MYIILINGINLTVTKNIIFYFHVLGQLQTTNARTNFKTSVNKAAPALCQDCSEGIITTTIIINICHHCFSSCLYTFLLVFPYSYVGYVFHLLYSIHL
jgi:hypothetical protein